LKVSSCPRSATNESFSAKGHREWNLFWTTFERWRRRLRQPRVRLPGAKCVRRFRSRRESYRLYRADSRNRRVLLRTQTHERWRSNADQGPEPIFNAAAIGWIFIRACRPGGTPAESESASAGAASSRSEPIQVRARVSRSQAVPATAGAEASSGSVTAGCCNW